MQLGSLDPAVMEAGADVGDVVWMPCPLTSATTNAVTS